MRFFIAVFFAVLLAPPPAFAAPAAADSNYGAIASEKRSDKSVGDAVDYPSKASAITAALTECNARSGKNNCVLRVWFHKQHCAAYAANSKETAYYFGDTKEDAIQKAHDDFPEGQVLDVACN